PRPASPRRGPWDGKTAGATEPSRASPLRAPPGTETQDAAPTLSGTNKIAGYSSLDPGPAPWGGASGGSCTTLHEPGSVRAIDECVRGGRHPAAATARPVCGRSLRRRPRPRGGGPTHAPGRRGRQFLRTDRPARSWRNPCGDKHFGTPTPRGG